MKRRDVLKGAAATAVLPVGALADAMESPKTDYEKLYWEAQQEIDSLEQDRFHLRRMSDALQIHPQDHGGAYLELTSEPDGTLILSNPRRGTEIRL